MCAKRSIINYMLCCDFENLFPGAPYSSFIRRTFYHISTIALLSGIFVAHAMRRNTRAKRLRMPKVSIFKLAVANANFTTRMPVFELKSNFTSIQNFKAETLNLQVCT